MISRGLAKLWARCGKQRKGLRNEPQLELPGTVSGRWQLITYSDGSVDQARTYGLHLLDQAQTRMQDDPCSADLPVSSLSFKLTRPTVLT